MATDVDSAVFTYRQMLVEIADDLDSSERKKLRYLCLDHIPASQLENEPLLSVFTQLEEQDVLSENNVQFLGGCLMCIGRRDLANKLDYRSNVGWSGSSTSSMDHSGLSMYRKLVLEIAEELDDSGLQKLIMLCKDDSNLTKRQLSEIKSPLDFLIALDKKRIISSNDMGYLAEQFPKMKKSALAKKIESYGILPSFKQCELENVFHYGTWVNSSLKCADMCTEPEFLSNWEDVVLFELNVNEKSKSELASERSPDIHVPLNDLSNIRKLIIDKNDDAVLSLTKDPSNLTQYIIDKNDDVELSSTNDLSNCAQYFMEKNDNVELSSTNVLSNITEYIIPVDKNDDLESQSTSCTRLSNSDIGDTVTMPSKNESITENALLKKRDNEEVDMPAYKMDASPRGICMILNNKTFNQTQDDPRFQELKDRPGTEKDADNLAWLFHSLGFIVYTMDNLTHVEMHEICTYMALKEDHNKFDCFICCILSHGIQDCIYGVNGLGIKIDELTAPFKRCRTLRGKPKLFFIQACQGNNVQKGYDIEADSPDHERQQASLLCEADFLIAHSTAPGYVSYRSKQTGSWYITKLVQLMDQYCDKYDLLSILTRVNEEVNKQVKSGNGMQCKQSPAPMSLLTKRVNLRKVTIQEDSTT